MICTTFADRVSLTWNHGKYKWNIPLGRNNLQIVRSNPEYDVSNSTTTNPWSNQIIKAYYSYIPKEVSNKQYHTLMPSTMKHNIDGQPKLGKCDPTEELLKFTLIPSTIKNDIDEHPKLGKCDPTEELLIWR
jgi:hypothetical protein